MPYPHVPSPYLGLYPYFTISLAIETTALGRLGSAIDTWCTTETNSNEWKDDSCMALAPM